MKKLFLILFLVLFFFFAATPSAFAAKTATAPTRVAERGDAVLVHYTGWIFDKEKKDQKGKEFDSSHKRKQPFKFTLGQKRVIPGWEKGIAKMKVGEKKKLIIPPQDGYGDQGISGVIPPHATLLFEVELLGIE